MHLQLFSKDFVQISRTPVVQTPLNGTERDMYIFKPG